MMNSTIIIVRLLEKLFEKTARQSKAFDTYQTQFLEALQRSPSEQVSNKLFEECIEQLEQDKTPLEETLSKGRLIASQSQLQLQKLDNLSAASQKKIAAAGAITLPYSISEHHNELTNIIKIYQRILIELNNTHALNQTKPSEYDDVCIELQQIILNLDIDKNYLKLLEEISQKLATLDDPFKLPHYCISIITIIIDSTRDERRSSRHFLYTLNDSLAQFYIDFSTKVKQAERSFETQNKRLHKIQKNSAILKCQATQAMDIELLRNDIFAYVESVEQLLKEKEKEKGYKIQLQLQGMVREIKELQNETQDYQNVLTHQHQQLRIDFLTKVPNRGAWSERIDIEYNRCKRYKNALHIAIIDVDHFKKINDTFGHLAGDKVLKTIAQTLQRSLRTADFIARYGGEEFAVLLPEVNQQQMLIALEKLRDKVNNIPFKFKRNKINITISVGCTSFVEEDQIDSAFERADKALYHAKKNGRNQVTYFAK